MLLVGRVAHEKNIGFLLRVLAEVRRSVPNVLFVIAGEGPALPALRRAAARRARGQHAVRRLSRPARRAARLLSRGRRLRFRVADRDSGPRAARKPRARRAGRLDGRARHEGGVTQCGGGHRRRGERGGVHICRRRSADTARVARRARRAPADSSSRSTGRASRWRSVWRSSTMRSSQERRRSATGRAPRVFSLIYRPALPRGRRRRSLRTGFARMKGNSLSRGATRWWSAPARFPTCPLALLRKSVLSQYVATESLGAPGAGPRSSAERHVLSGALPAR